MKYALQWRSFGGRYITMRTYATAAAAESERAALTEFHTIYTFRVKETA